jgi:uncharacterized protein YndB with AHSA1/START domain
MGFVIEKILSVPGLRQIAHYRRRRIGGQVLWPLVRPPWRYLSIDLYKNTLIRSEAGDLSLPELDVLRYIGAVTRLLEIRGHNGRPARVVTAACAYDTTIEDLWDAVTNPERISRWFLPVSGDLRLGGRYQLHGNAGGEITACDPPRAFDVTWEFGGQVSWLNVRLTTLADGGTQLRLEHIEPSPEEMWKQFGPGAVGVGWDLTLFGLGRHLETEAAVDPKAAAAWLTTAEGREFITRSSGEWRRASIAAGTPEDAAGEAAARTTAAYTGQG